MEDGAEQEQHTLQHYMSLVVSLVNFDKAAITLQDGTRMFLVVYDWDNARGILLAREGGGTLFWDAGVGQLEPIHLLDAGFPNTLSVAHLCRVLNWVVWQCGEIKRAERESA